MVRGVFGKSRLLLSLVLVLFMLLLPAMAVADVRGAEGPLPGIVAVVPSVSGVPSLWAEKESNLAYSTIRVIDVVPQKDSRTGFDKTVYNLKLPITPSRTLNNFVTTEVSLLWANECPVGPTKFYVYRLHRGN